MADTFTDAAYQVLKDAGKPLRTAEIWKRIETEGLYETSGKTPEQTLTTELLRSSLGTGVASGRQTRLFYKAGPAQFGLLEWLSSEDLQELEREDELVKKRNIVPKPDKSAAAKRAAHRERRLARRADPEWAERVFRANFSDEESLRLCAGAYADIIQQAHHRNPESWQITWYRQLINLNVGMCVTLRIRKGRTWIALAESELSEEARGLLEEHGEEHPKKGFKSVPNSMVYFVPNDKLQLLWEAVHPAVSAFVDLAARVRSPYSSAHSPGVVAFLRQYLKQDLPDPAYEVDTPESGSSSFEALFEEFVADYLETEDGEDHLAMYEPARAQGRMNFKEISAKRAAGEDVTDDILLKLLPHNDTTGNRERGAWIHVASAVTKDLKSWFEGANWTSAEDWPAVADAIFGFIERSVDDPSRIQIECDHFSDLAVSKGLQTGMLSPILNALRPDEFAIVNRRSRRTLNHFAGTSYGLKLRDYPGANESLHSLIATHHDTLAQPDNPGVRLDDIFDLFSHWLVGIRKSFNVAGSEIFGDEEQTENDEDPEVVSDEGDPADTIQPLYTREQFCEETGFSPSQLEEWLRILRRKRQIVLQGPPGTGKTFVAQRLARLIVSGADGVRETIQFHPAYAYEDFMRGIRPRVVQGGLSYDWEDGRFLNFCAQAAAHDGPSVLVIDEINRANLSRVFGELMYLLEYRNEAIPLAGGEELFSIPANVFLVGTMNTADRSIARLDHALRRRFSFVRLRPAYDVLRAHLEARDLPGDSLVSALEAVNRLLGDPNYEVGISYFMRKDADLRKHLADIWRYEIETYLEEYFYDQPTKISEFRWEAVCKARLKDWT